MIASDNSSSCRQAGTQTVRQNTYNYLAMVSISRSDGDDFILLPIVAAAEEAYAVAAVFHHDRLFTRAL
jgi:hypothetical protein